jgi:hypothetical protein
MICNKLLTSDHPGCPRETLGPSGGLARTLRRRVAEEGWARTEAGGDLCPDHSPPRASLPRHHEVRHRRWSAAGGRGRVAR